MAQRWSNTESAEMVVAFNSTVSAISPALAGSQRASGRRLPELWI